MFLSLRGLLHRNYPEDSAAPTEPRTTLNIANKQVSCLQYSGELLMTANFDKTFTNAKRQVA